MVLHETSGTPNSAAVVVVVVAVESVCVYVLCVHVRALVNHPNHVKLRDLCCFGSLFMCVHVK